MSRDHTGELPLHEACGLLREHGFDESKQVQLSSRRGAGGWVFARTGGSRPKLGAHSWVVTDQCVVGKARWGESGPQALARLATLSEGPPTSGRPPVGSCRPTEHIQVNTTLSARQAFVIPRRSSAGKREAKPSNSERRTPRNGRMSLCFRRWKTADRHAD